MILWRSLHGVLLTTVKLCGVSTAIIFLSRSIFSVSCIMTGVRFLTTSSLIRSPQIQNKILTYAGSVHSHSRY